MNEMRPEINRVIQKLLITNAALVNVGGRQRQQRYDDMPSRDVRDLSSAEVLCRETNAI